MTSYLLGEAYAFGVVWSFAFNALAVLVLRFKLPDAPREWKVPFNLRVGGRELPIGLVADRARAVRGGGDQPVHEGDRDDLRPDVHAAAFFTVFVVSERITARRRAAATNAKLDQFQLTPEPEVGMRALHCAPHSILVPVRDYNTLSHLDWVVQPTDTENRDIVVRHAPAAARSRRRCAISWARRSCSPTTSSSCSRGWWRWPSGTDGSVKLLVAPATNIFDAVVQTAVQLQSDEIVVGESAKMAADQQALLLGEAWDRTPHERELTTRLVVLSRRRYGPAVLPRRARAGALASGHRAHPPPLGRCGQGCRTERPPPRHRRGGARQPRETSMAGAERERGDRPPAAPGRRRVMSRDALGLCAAIGGVAAVTMAYTRWLHVTNATTVALTFLLVVLVVAATSRLWIAVTTSIVAMLCFNFFFLPPVGTLTIADPQNWVALFAFLAVSLVASNLSSVARDRAEEALARRDELARLFDLSRDVLLMTDSREAISAAGAVHRAPVRSRLRRRSACPRSADWDVHAAGSLHADARHARPRRGLRPEPERALEFDATARTYAGHRTMSVDGHLGAPRAAAARDQADRPAGRRRPAGGARHARRAGRRGRDRDRARAVPRGAQEQRSWRARARS